MADEKTLKRINEILLQGIYDTGIDADPSANNSLTGYPTEHGDLIRELENNGTLDELQDLVGGEEKLGNLIQEIAFKQEEVSPRYLESTPPLDEYGEEFGAKGAYGITTEELLQTEIQDVIKQNLGIDTPTNVVGDANVYYHSRIENLSDASDTHFGTYNAALDRASLQYGKENIKNFYTRALRDAYDELVNELDGLEYVIEDGEYTLPEKQIQFGFEHFNEAVPPKSQDIQFLIELDGYQGINLYVLDDGYPVEIERFDAGGLLYDAEEGSIETFRNTDAEYVFGRKEDFALQSEYVSRMQEGVPLDVYRGDFDVDSKYNLYEMKVKPDAKVFDISGKEIEIVNTFRKQGETTYNTKSTVVSSEFLQYELFAENAPGLGKVSEIKIDGVSYKPKSEVFQSKEEIIQVLSGDADVIIYTNEIEDAGSSSLYVRNADAVDVSLVDEERLAVFNEDVNTKYYQTSPLDEDLLRKLSQGKITQEQYDKYKQPYTDTPTNVVDDVPALLETRMKLDTSIGPYPALNGWEDDVIQPNKIYAPNKMETTKIGVMNSTFKSGEEVIEAINKGIATDEDITRFFIYVSTQSPYSIYAGTPMSNADAIADIVKIGIFSETPISELLPFNTQDPWMNTNFKETLSNNYNLRNVDFKIYADMITERGQFTNLKERMRKNILDAHKKIYTKNPNDYFILWRGGELSRFYPWQSMSKSGSEAGMIQYMMQEKNLNKGGELSSYVINKNNMIDLDALGLSYGTEREVIVLTEAANKPGAKMSVELDTIRQLDEYKDSWQLRREIPEFKNTFPKDGFTLNNNTKRLNELGQTTQNFFNELISGMNPDLKPNKPYEQIIELNNKQLQNAQDTYNKYIAQGGDFNPHYFTSIPTVYETQIVKAQALINMLDNNQGVTPFSKTINILDIGGTEGAWANTVAEIGSDKVYVEILEPNFEGNKLYESMQTPNNTKFRNEAFSYIIEDQGKFFNEQKMIQFAEFSAGGIKDPKTGVRNPDIQIESGKYDVVHEAMTFQFLDKNRKAQIDFIADNLLTDDGVLLIEEKFTNNDVVYQNNENMKDEFKRNYYTEEQINSKAQNIVGPMGDKQVSVQEIENILGNRFKYVNQYWDSGNFKGYIASNNPLSETFVDEIHALDTSLTNHRFSTAPTQEELKYAVQKDMRNRGIDIELAKDVAKRFVESNTQFIQSASDALGEVYKVGKAVAPAVGSLALRGLAKAAPVLAPGDVLVEGALAKTAPYVDDFAKRLGFASLPLASIINTYIAADIAAAGAEVVSAAMYAYDETQRNAPQQSSKFQESLTKFLLPKAYEDEAVQKLQIPQDLESFYRTPAGQQFLEDNDFGSLFKKQIDQEKLTKYAPGWQLSKAIFSLFGSMGREQANISEKTRGNMGQALLTGIGK